MEALVIIKNEEDQEEAVVPKEEIKDQTPLLDEDDEPLEEVKEEVKVEKIDGEDKKEFPATETEQEVDGIPMGKVYSRHLSRIMSLFSKLTQAASQKKVTSLSKRDHPLDEDSLKCRLSILTLATNSTSLPVLATEIVKVGFLLIPKESSCQECQRLCRRQFSDYLQAN